VQRPTRPHRIPSVLTTAEVAALFGAMTGVAGRLTLGLRRFTVSNPWR